MQLELLMTYHASLKPAQPVGAGPYGNRQIAEVTGGRFEGPKLRGEVLTCGGDWILIDDKGFGHLDVRATFKTHDDAYIYAQYGGVLEFNDAVNAAFANGTATSYGDNYFMTQPRFETGDERYVWLNNLVTVGQGRIIPNGVEYQLYACRND